MTPEAYARRTFRLLVMQVIVVLSGLTVLLVVVQQQNSKVSERLQLLALENRANIIDHRLASRCHEYQDTVLLDYLYVLIHRSTPHRPFPAAVRHAIEAVPAANIAGVDCKAELTDNLAKRLSRRLGGPP